MISTRDLSQLPSPAALRHLLQAMAMLDAILQPDWQYRYYSFNARWSPTEQMGSMRDGCGDDFFCVFDTNGCLVKGFAHEAPMGPHHRQPPEVWPDVLDHVPPQYAASIREPAFKMADTTFCIWRGLADPVWQCGPVRFPAGSDPDGSAALLSPLDGLTETYKAWAEGYYERTVPLSAVASVYQHKALDAGLLKTFDCSRSLLKLAGDAREIGYPL